MLGESIQRFDFLWLTCAKNSKPMKKSLIITGLLLLAGCSLFDSEDLIFRKRREETGSWMGSGPKKERNHEELIPGDTTVYVSTVEFPKDYCWQKDSVGENRPFSLVLYRNFKKVLSVKGGGIVSSDPDMHWIIGGHLYAEYSTGTETIVSIDGKEKVRYEGREMIRGLLDREDGFYTLGQSRSGTGLTFRRNGEIIFSDEEGIVLGDMSNPCCRSGGLYELDDGVPVFCYHVPGQSILLKKESLYLVKNGVPNRVELDGTVANVLDARVLNGNMCLVYSYGGGGIALFDGGNTRMPSIGKSYVSSDLCLRWSGKSVFAKMNYSINGWNSILSTMWNVRGESITHGTGLIYDYYFSDDGIGYVYTDMADLCYRFISTDGSSKECNSGNKYCFMGSNCACLCGDTFYMGLTPAYRDFPPVVYIDSRPEIMPINGYITGVSAVVNPPN